MNSQKLKSGAILLFLLTILSCSSPEIVYRTREVYIKPSFGAFPEIIYRPFEGQTNQEFFLWSIENDGLLQQCLIDRDMVNTWLNQLPVQ